MLMHFDCFFPQPVIRAVTDGVFRIITTIYVTEKSC